MSALVRILRPLGRLHGRLADPAVALTLFAVGMLGFLVERTPGIVLPWERSPDPLAFGLLAAQTAPLVWRRRAPLLVFAAVLLATVALRVGTYPFTGADLASAVAFFTLASRDRPLRVLQAAAVLAAGVISLTLLGRLSFETFVLLHLVYGAAWVLGGDLRRRRLRERALLEQAETAERERQHQLEQAVAGERVRMAQELHDLAAHAFGVIAIQAQAGRRAIPGRPDQASASFSAIASMSEEALADLRPLLGFLRGDAPGERRPQPGLADLDQLLGGFRRAGLPVTLTEWTDRERLPGTVQASAYRIIQEALTNVLKHAGRAQAQVTLQQRADALEIDVMDDGHGPPPGSGMGEGLMGMRERVSMLGGELQAGPQPEGGYAVHVRLPVLDRVRT